MITSVKTKLAVFVPSLRGGGAQRAMLNLACGLAEREDLDVDLVLAQKEGPYLNQVSDKVNVVDLGASRTLTALPKLIRYLRREQPAGMISAQDYGNLIAIWSRSLSRSRTRLVISEQNNPARWERSNGRYNGRFVLSLLGRFYPWADGISTVSDGVGDHLAAAASIPRELIQTIHNPIARTDIAEPTHQDVPHPWFEQGEPPVIVGVGSLTPQKDFPLLIRAFARVRQQMSARLMILGEGVLRGELEQLIESLGVTEDVALPGFVDEPYEYMCRASLFVLSSQYEGLPSVLIEALCCGLPVVATDCPSGPQEILNGGKYGSIVPVGDLDALAAAIEQSLKSGTPPPAESYEPYRVEKVVDRYLDVLFGSDS